MSDRKSLIEYSLFYKTYSKCLDLINEVFANSRSRIKKYRKGSISDKIISELFKDKNQITITTSLFIIALLTPLIGSNFINGNFKNITNAIMIIFCIVSMLAIWNIKGIVTAIDNSFLIKGFKSIFTIDDRGEK